MTAKERLLKSLRGEPTDRPPVICPGGMMNAAVTEVIAGIAGNHNTDPQAMAEASRLTKELTGFENYGVPFCMTIEAELVNGVEVDYGNKFTEARVTKYTGLSIDEIIASPLNTGRARIVTEAIKLLKNNNTPVIGNLTGPFSVATSVIDPLEFIKMLRKAPEKAIRFLDFILNYSLEFINDMIEAGADVIAISDPTATGEILGSRNFNTFIIPLYQKISKVLQENDIPFILHICGNAKTILESLGNSGADILSFDSIVNVEEAKNKSRKHVMGNINTQLLDTGKDDTIAAHTLKALKIVRVVSPACGLSMSTPLSNLKIMTDTVKNLNT